MPIPALRAPRPFAGDKPGPFEPGASRDLRILVDLPPGQRQVDDSTTTWGRDQLGEAVGQHPRHQPVLADRPAAGPARGGERGHLRGEPFRGPQAAGRHHQPLEPEPLVRERHPVTLGADQVGRRNAHLGERDDRVVLADRMRPYIRRYLQAPALVLTECSVYASIDRVPMSDVCR
jgi:hypothetical protein